MTGRACLRRLTPAVFRPKPDATKTSLAWHPSAARSGSRSGWLPAVAGSVFIGVALVAMSPLPVIAQNQGHRPLFPPKDLGLLEMPDRAAWQKPEQIMDALNIADGAHVADIGAGAGWFTIRIARRVGPPGRVYAVEVQVPTVDAIRRRVAREGLENVELILGSETDPRLPAGTLDAALIVDTYPEIEQRSLYLRTLARALKPGGRIGVVNYKPGDGGPGPERETRVDSVSVEADARAAGLRVLARENLPFQYLLVLGR